MQIKSPDEHVYAGRLHCPTDTLPRCQHCIFLAGGERQTRVRRRRRLLFVRHGTRAVGLCTRRQFSQLTTHFATIFDTLFRAPMTFTFRGYASVSKRIALLGLLTLVQPRKFLFSSRWRAVFLINIARMSVFWSFIYTSKIHEQIRVAVDSPIPFFSF